MRVGAAYLYCADNLADASDGKSDRTIRRIVNAALSELQAAHEWTRYQATAAIPLDLGVTNTAVTVAQDDDVLTFGATSQVLPRYLSESWHLSVTGDDQALLQIGSIDSPTQARLVSPQRWTAVSVTAAEHTWKRSVYPLPARCKAIRACMLQQAQVYVSGVSLAELHMQRFSLPTETGQPLYFALNDTALEVWPPLGADGTRDTLLLTYYRQPAQLGEHTSENDLIDFDPRWDDLLEAAFDMQIAARFGKSTTLTPGMASARYRDRLSKAKGEDGGRDPEPRTFGLSRVPTYGELDRSRFSRMPQGPDA